MFHIFCNKQANYVGDSHPFRTGDVYRTTRFSRKLYNLEGLFLAKMIAYLMSSRFP